MEKNKNDNIFRRFIAQFIAVTINNFLMLDTGMTFAVPSIIIPALTGIFNEHNQNEFLRISPTQSSWMVSILVMVQPIGCFISAPLTDPLGRKLSMILVNIPFAIGWYLLYRADDVWQIYVGFAMLGLGASLMEAPAFTFLGEICEPSFRGILLGYAFICASFGGFTIFLLNTMLAWRTVCLICFTIPVITAIAICFLPETPQWLLSKNRTAKAEKSLRWYRGFVSSEVVAKEFNDLKRHSNRSKSCYACIKKNVECTHPLPTICEKLAELKRKQTLKPLFIVVAMFFLSQFAGMTTMKPFIVQIFKAYNSPVTPDKAVTIMSFLDNFANVMYILLVRFSGKRRFYLTCLTTCFICTVTLTWYGFTYLPSGSISFVQADREPLENLENKTLGWIPMISLLVWNFFAHVTVSMPWILLSEIFPFKVRGIASGTAACVNYLLSTICRGTYYTSETLLSLPGVSMLYASIILIGLILMYKILPETENRTLEDIELHFSDKSKGLIDRKIAIHKPIAKNEFDVNGNNSKINRGLDNDVYELEKV